MKWAATCISLSVLMLIQWNSEISDGICEVATELAEPNQPVITNLSASSKTSHVAVTTERESTRSASRFRWRQQSPLISQRQRHSIPKSGQRSRKRPGGSELTIHACGAALHSRVNEVCELFERAIGARDASRHRRAIPERSSHSIRLDQRSLTGILLLTGCSNSSCIKESFD